MISAVPNRRLRAVASHIDTSVAPAPAPVAAHGDVDLIIRGASLVVGDGATSQFIGDIAVKDGKIVQVGGTFVGTAAEEVDGTGKIVTPGFIDIHTCARP